jgi:diguanylate cyclase
MDRGYCVKQHELQLDEPFQFAAEKSEDEWDSANLLGWRCLIVDDDDGVHQAIVFAMNNQLVEGRPIEWLHARSAEEGCDLLAREKDIAVILLDVVMEHEKAGLDMVRTIRVRMGLHDTRIVLHTGQPGFAPEIAAIRDYDINDYRTKSELTRNHIYTCLATAIRTYRQIRRIEASRLQLRRIIQAGNSLMREPDEAAFAASALVQLSEVFGVPAIGCALLRDEGDDPEHLRVVTTCGSCGSCMEGQIDSDRMLCQRGLPENEVEWSGNGVALTIRARSGACLILYLRLEPGIREWVDNSVTETFIAHVAACLDNHSLLGQMHHDAYYDRALGISNRRRLGDLIDACYALATQDRQVLSLVDIDRFGEINEALGQSFGDALLKAVVDRLHACVPKSVALARVSADVFAVFGVQDCVTPEYMLSLFATPLLVHEEDTMVSVTIGMTRLADVDQGCGATVLEAAFQALRTAKAMQRGQLAWYSPEQSQKTHERVSLLNGLRLALRHDGLFVVFQPQVTLLERRLIGLEALVRWRTDSGGLIGPDRFIQIAEQSGLIREIGFFVLRQACSVLANLSQRGSEKLRMAVNVSAIQFRHPAFLVVLRQIIMDSGIDPFQLELEITESMAMEDAPYVCETLDALHAMGINLVVDDFGTGYSSLAQLKELAVDRLKIDKAFVRDLREADADASIAGVVIQLGRRLGKEVIAEGVETEEQAQLLVKLGCTEGQGFLFSPPMELHALQEWMLG